jgi:ATP/maltotriose-dependent transcriptional regulator MalT
MQHTYSFCGSPLHLVLEDEIAEGYNRFHDAFIEGQMKFMEEHRVQWTPDQPLYIITTDKDQKAYHEVGRVINLLVEINGGGLQITEEECTSDHLERV